MGKEMYVRLFFEQLETDPDEVTKVIGVKPTRVARIGDRHPKMKIKSRQNFWEYRIDAGKKLELDPLVRKLLSKFKNKKRLARATSMWRAEVVCILYTNDREPLLVLERETIRELADLNCGFFLDLYLIPERRKRGKAPWD